MRLLLALSAVLFLGCGAGLSITDVEAEQATQTLSGGGYKEHFDDDSGLDKIRYQAIYCGSTGILLRSGHPTSSTSDAGPQCPTVAP
jgi:hypothetical protein